MQTYVCIQWSFKGLGITERAQLAWQCNALWWELRLTGLPSLPTGQPFIKSMPPLNTTLPCGAGPGYSLLPLPVREGKHRQIDKLELLQLPSSHPQGWLLFWSDNSTVSNIKQDNTAFQTWNPAFKLRSLQPIIYFFLYGSVIWENHCYPLDWVLMGNMTKWLLESLHTSKNRILDGKLKKTFANIISAEKHT